MIMKLKIQVEEDKRIEEILRSQLEEKEKDEGKLGSINSFTKEINSEKRYATEQHQNIG
jgi:hypothetical protein